MTFLARAGVCWVMAFGSMAAGSAFAQNEPRMVSVTGPVVPSQKTIDLRLLPQAIESDGPRSPRDAEPEQHDQYQRMRDRPWLQGVPVLTTQWQSSQSTPGWRTPLMFGNAQPNVAGINYTFVLPADPTGDAGPNHYVQAVNGTPSTRFAVYDKISGALLAGPSDMSALASGDCAQDVADPQVIYDTLAERWLLARIVANAKVCVLLSSGSDPILGTWTQYEFPFAFFPDYPKLAVWDSAYGLTFNSSIVEGTNVRLRFAVLDRTAMLAGLPATAQTFETARVSNGNNPFAPLTPVGFKGFNAPKANTPIMFLTPIDDEYQFIAEPAEINPITDRLMLYTVTPDFATPAQTVVSGPTPIPVLDMQLYVGTFPLQPNGQFLPSFAGSPMHRTTYRNLGDREVMTLSLGQSVDPFTNYGDPTIGRTMGAHWIELERINGSAGSWTVANQGVYGPGDGASRFMPAISVDSAGNLAMAFSTMRESPAIEPGLRFTGRLRGDAANTMSFAETNLASGAQSQSLPLELRRWGDYFDMSMDPDGCRFWFTGAYMDDATWGTRIASFKHDDCGPPNFMLSGNSSVFPVCSASGNTALPTQSVLVGARNAFWRDVQMSFPAPPAGITAQVTPVTLRPTANASVDISIAQGTSSGLKTITLQGSDGVLNNSFDFRADVDAAATAPVMQTAPADGAVSQPSIVTLQWQPIPGARDYVVELAQNAAFSPILFGRLTSDTSVATTLLPGNTQFFWRVRGRNHCGEGSNSVTRTFTTIANFCRTVNTPVGNAAVVNDTITVPAASAGVLQNIDIRFVLNNLPVSDLRVDLTRLSDNRSVRLLESGCSASTSINATFDDEAAAPVCAGSNVASRIQPTQLLSQFDGGSLAGDWRITATNTGSGSGQFILWCLQPQSLLPLELFANGFE
jgi:hypothetical protein